MMYSQIASAVVVCLMAAGSIHTFSLPSIKIGSGHSYSHLAASASSSSPSIASSSSSSSSSSPFSLPAIRLGSKVSSSSPLSSGGLSSLSLPAIKLGSKATIGGFGGTSSRMMTQTIRKMESYAAGNGYRQTYGVSSAIRPRPFYPVPMGSMSRPIYRMPSYMPINRLRMSPSMQMGMFMPRPTFPMSGFRPPMRSPFGGSSMPSMSSMSSMPSMPSMSSMSSMPSMSSFGSRGRGRGLSSMGSMGPSMGSMGSMDGSMGSFGDMSSLAGLGDSDFTGGADSLFDSSGDVSSAFSSMSDGDEYKLGGESDAYKLADTDDKSEYSMDTDSMSDEERGELDASKLGEGSSMTLGDSPMRTKSAQSETGDDASDDSLKTNTGMSDEDDGDKVSVDFDIPDDQMPNLPVYSGSSKKKSSKKNSSSKKKPKKLNYKVMYQALKAYNQGKRDAAKEYNSDDDKSELVTMYRNQAAMIVDNNEGGEGERQRARPQVKHQADTHERNEHQLHAANDENNGHEGSGYRGKVESVDDSIDTVSKNAPNRFRIDQEDSIASDAPQGYERPVYHSSIANITPVSTESPPPIAPQQLKATSQSPPQQQQVVYAQQPPTPVTAISYQLPPQVQPVEYVPVRSRRPKAQAEIIEEDDDEEEEHPKRRAKKVVYVVRKSKKESTPVTHADDDEDDSEGSRRSRAKSTGRRGPSSVRHSYKQNYNGDNDDESYGENYDSLAYYNRRAESRIRPLIVKVKDPFVEAAELASFVGALSRNLPIATPRSSTAAFYPAAFDSRASFANTYITAGSPVAGSPSASTSPLPVPFHTQLQPLAFYPNTVQAPAAATQIAYTIPLATIANAPALTVATAQASPQHTSGLSSATKLERRSIIPALGEQVMENTRGLALRAAESVESSIRSVVEGGLSGRKSNTGVGTSEARSGVFGSIRKAISDALARNHEVSDQIVKAKERRKIDDIVKVVDHVSSNPSNKAIAHKQIQPILKLAADPSLASLADTLSPAPVLPVATSPVLPLPVDSVESAGELDHLFPFKRSSENIASETKSETQETSAAVAPVEEQSNDQESSQSA